MVDEARKYLQENAISVMALAAVAIFALTVLGILVVMIKTNEIDDAKAELKDERRTRAGVERERDAARGRAAALLDKRDTILAEAKATAAKLVNSAQSKRDKLENTLSRLEVETETASDELSEVDSSLEGAERTRELSHFGNGIWEAEVDYVPGTYRAPGGAGCYWAKLSSANTSDIEDNNFTTNGGQQVVTIDSPYFQTEGCGAWERIGE